MAEGFPAENTPVEAGAVGYHLRHGPYLLTEYDWACLLDHVSHALQHFPGGAEPVLPVFC